MVSTRALVQRVVLIIPCPCLGLAAGDVYMCGERNRYQNGGVQPPGGGAHNVYKLLGDQKVVRLACGESHIIVATEDGRA
jgi:hypothetical protein